jgi:nitrogenase molybdenum-iron protein NifN
MQRLVRTFRTRYPQFSGTAVVPVNTPDDSGCLETGFALAVEAIIDTLVPDTSSLPLAGRRPQQVNVLAASMLTPGDIEAIKAWIEAFGLQPLVLPDIGDSLDGHLVDQDSTPLTLGGTPQGEVATLGQAAATIVIGRSLKGAADLMKKRTGVPDFRFDHLQGLDACDAFTLALAAISGQAVPAGIERQRAQLQDAMVDTHFMTGFLRVALAADPDLLLALGQLFAGVGAEIVAAVASSRAELLAELPAASVRIGDLEDLERAALAHRAQIIVANSHAVASAERLQLPILRAGFPQYDWVGGYARTWVGYRGARQTLFDVANLFLGNHHDTPVHRSIYRVDSACDAQNRPLSGAGLVHH